MTGAEGIDIGRKETLTNSKHVAMSRKRPGTQRKKPVCNWTKRRIQDERCARNRKRTYEEGGKNPYNHAQDALEQGDSEADMGRE